MKKRLIARALAFCLLSCLLSLTASAQEVQPSPTPMPLSVRLECAVEARYDGGWKTLRSHLVYSHIGSMYRDGFLHFMPLAVFVNGDHVGEIPTAALTEEFDVRVTFDESADSGNYTCVLYVPKGKELERCATENLVWSELEEGRYLLAINHRMSRGEDYYSGVSFLWLEAGGGAHVYDRPSDGKRKGSL